MGRATASTAREKALQLRHVFQGLLGVWKGNQIRKRRELR